ncbi:dynein heavy chain 1, axonemal-like isoform X1 [Octopus sinensis]|uniref:Dynein heavy chain 1, axonemal-like isoform X1 n=1 Tax=Octopus sinensis TaxID=2607531 RepID=A0A7E6FH10_9MOLL|nr:dynein heavy chain 1, axonemal-like isoform X1 [Octopus sinensis]
MDPNLLAPIKSLASISMSRRRSLASQTNSITNLKKQKKEQEQPTDLKEQGYYSEIIAKDSNKSLPVIVEPQNIRQNTLWNIQKVKYSPQVSACNIPPEVALQKLTGEIYEKTTAPTSKSDFPWKSFEAKVQLPYYTPTGKCPRKIEIERRRRLYASLNLTDLLTAEGISCDELIPINIFDSESKNIDIIEERTTPFKTYLPLEIFDNEEYDCRTPYEWVRMGEENNILKPVPGLAFLKNHPKEDQGVPVSSHTWKKVGVLGYKAETKEYFVQEVNSEGRLIDDDGNLVVGITDPENVILAENQSWTPRIYLMFCAEDPRVFAKRIAEAVKQRKTTEALLRYHLYVDCMPMDGVGELDQASLKRMTEWAKNTSGIYKDKNLEDHVQLLEKEVNIDFCRTMNKIIFDKTVRDDPITFTFVTQPEPIVEKLSTKGVCGDVPDYPFEEQYDKFAFTSLLTREETVHTCVKLRTECNKVASMSLFHVPTTKPLKIDEFEQTQSQATAQISLFLKDSWISTLRAAIRTSLRDIGKGWFNIHESNWEVYQKSKLKTFMEMVKFIMQDTLRYLVNDSLYNFAQMIHNSCRSTLDIDESFTWTGDLINSPFKPKKTALFFIELIVDEQGPHYSTTLADFESCVLSLFDKGINSTQAVPQLEKYILEDIFWSGTPLLESVGEHEPHVEEMRSTIQTTIQKSIIPAKAYAERYNKYVELCNLDVNKFISTYAETERPAVEIQEEAEKHLQEKGILEDEIPLSITIGPFWVTTSHVRETVSKKKKALTMALLDLLARQLSQQTEEVCETFKQISRKQSEKPNTIEELDELREWMKSIPEKIKDQQEQIDKIVVDYGLLENFFYNLSIDDFNNLWAMIGWPLKIEKQTETILLNHEADEERFRKLQLLDQAAFNEKLDSLAMMAASMQSYTDVNKAHEIANEARRISKQMKDAQQLAQVYNNRERLFKLPITQYDKLHLMVKEFEPFRSLWVTASDWQRWHDSWLNDPLLSINAEDVEKNVLDSYKIMHKSVRIFQDSPVVQEVAIIIKGQIEEFRPFIPLFQGLRNPGMRNRHWDQLSDELGFQVRPKSNLTFSKCLEMKLQDYIEVIAKVAEVAGKEYSIEQALNKMEKEWEPVLFEIMPYKNTGTHILKCSDDTSQMLDDHIVMTQSMSFSPYKKAFEAQISAWENKLRISQDVLDEWLACQRSWMYLEPIFTSEDISRQLPVESKRYQTMERLWRKIMKNAKENPQVINLCADARLLDSLKECNKLLDQVQKGLTDYLETKRSSFPRFYFLSDDELLEILSQTKDPTAVQPHLRKCFENIARLKFEKDLQITKMYSGEGEEVDFKAVLYPIGNVECWMLNIEETMRESLRLIIKAALECYPATERPTWVLEWPGQVVIAGCQTFWTEGVTHSLQDDTIRKYHELVLSQLDDLRKLVRGEVPKIGRLTLSALIVIEVHSRDVVAKIIDEKVNSANDFEWISQLRYYWKEEDLKICAVNAEFKYGYEYLGNTSRLVITPLTDRCYLTLTGALHLKFGGAPAGPAGTGKTETTKDLAKAMAIQCVVFNCSDQLDYMAMGKFLKGLASSGAWACFDEFNRIDIEVLSVVAMQLTTIVQALIKQVDRFFFEGVEIALKPSCAVFITMNPGYAGRTELPDNLKALFRPVAMMVPDYALIAEISLFSFGFSEAKVLAQKIVSTFKLSSEQLSTQDHYDFGMRAVKSVISAAGNLKRQQPDMKEDLITLRAIQDVNVPKFLVDDLKLFNGIVSDLFPNTKEEPIDYGSLDTALKKACRKFNLKAVQGFIHKCIQLYETTVVRHGLMLVGPTGSGKTKCYEVLKFAITSLKGEMSPSGEPFEKVQTFVLNPKSITMGQLYGEFDLLTHEWTDGILSSLIRASIGSQNNDKKWYVFDGPVDAVWIENMNTVLDDNKKLCLSSGEIIKLEECMTMMFEVQDLAVASPATVSRCGMVYLEPSILGLNPFVECWLNSIPPSIQPFKERLAELFDLLLKPAINFLRENMKEIVSTVDSNLTFSFFKLLNCHFEPFRLDDPKTKPPEYLNFLKQLIEPWFFFCMIWTIGATCDHDGRVKFSEWIREQMNINEIEIKIPDSGLIYDYKINDGCESDDEDEDEPKDIEIKYVHWSQGQPIFTTPVDAKFADIIVPTIDTIRNSFILDMLLKNNKTVLCVGPTGTGKTLTIADKLIHMPSKFISEFIVFSAKTGSNQTQDLIDGKLDKRRKGVYGPPLGKMFLFFIDDLNMPALEAFGAQPPIELLRQWMDFGGWYDRKSIGEFHNLVDVNFVCSMGPPGAGRNAVTARLLRHFNFLAFTEMEDISKKKIFGTIFESWIADEESVTEYSEQLVDTSILVYNTITTQLLPTPAKSHYTFNLRDLSKVFQGMLMGNIKRIKSISNLLRLWYHESCRVFQDRLVNNEDRNWFNECLKQRIEEDFEIDFDEVIVDHPVLFTDFMSRSGDIRNYEEVTDYQKLSSVLDEFLEDYNQISINKMKLVLFMDAITHITRIGRVIRQPYGNALLLGMGGSGRQSLTRLASHIVEFDCFQVELSKNYGISEWKEDLKKVLMKSGIENQAVVFLFSDTQIKNESFLEDLNNILNAGDVPNIYSLDELDKIYEAMKPSVQDMGLQPTKTNLYTCYTKRVRSNLHTVITMSPLGEVFRARLRQFPALVNCCTIDWFSAWPEDALQSVALRFLEDIPELGIFSEKIDSLVYMCQYIHSTVAVYTDKYRQELSRHNYVTPTSYLELLGTFSKLIKLKKDEISTAWKRLKTGLDKLLATANDVAILQEDLARMRPLLDEAVKESVSTMEQIAQDTKVSEETKVVVQNEEAQAGEKTRETQAIADDAQRDLSEALPALEEALASLKTLNKNDVVEVRAMQRPPDGVRLVIDAVCIMKSVKPKRVPGEKVGSKVDDYWEPGKALLQDPGKFLESLLKYDKENIPEETIKKISPYMEDEAFTPHAISKVSKACTSICQWVRAMYKYYFVAKAVAPKREALKIAQADLYETQKILDAAKQRLQAVQDGIESLQAKYDDTMRKKKDLEEKCEQCQARLVRADKLIGGLADEKNRWKASALRYEKIQDNMVGDVMVSAAYIAYLGTFTGEYRAAMYSSWIQKMHELDVPQTDDPSLISTLSDPVLIRQWQINGLPKDNLSVENGVIVHYARRWPLFIDPQGQANKWIKAMEKDNSLDVIKLSDKDFLRTLENAIRFGKPCLLENVTTELDPVLEPVLLKQTYRQQGSLVIKLGDAVVPYHEDFKFYITTKLPNPHYTPEISTKVTLVNFTLSPSGLEDQLLGIVVAEERPDLEEAKNQLIVSNAKMKQELKEIEDKILNRLSSSEGNPVDDFDLISTLEASKIKSEEIKAKVTIAEQTEKDIDETRGQYIPVAVNTRIMFFCVADLANIDPMYQYSLEWFINIFLFGIEQAEKADNIPMRVENINKYFTYSLYTNVCRSLFEKHKLLFAFLVCTKIKMNDSLIDMSEWHNLLAGGTHKELELENPAPEWLTERSWNDILCLNILPNFGNIAVDFQKYLDDFKRIFDSSEPHREELPEEWESKLDSFQKILILKCLRSDKVTNAMQDFVANNLGQMFIEPQTSDLGVVYKDSSPTTPLIFVLSQGTDPAADLYKFAEEMKFSRKMSAISLGQGQGPRAEAMMRAAQERGKWVFFQNCHLAPSWMPSLERLIELIEPDKVHRDFRLWLTSMPSTSFPVFILQNSSKMTVEPPKGIKANLLKSYMSINDDYLNSLAEKSTNFKSLILSLCLFHGVILERRRFGPLGFNIPYEFTDGDLKICMSQLKMFLSEYTEIPFKVLKYTAGHINYGGRVTDDHDRRCLMTILDDFYNSQIFEENFAYSESKIYKQISSAQDHNGYMAYIRNLPINDTPEIFGLHDNANITCAQTDTFQLLTWLLNLQPKISTGVGTSREEATEETAKDIIQQLPNLFHVKSVMEQYPILYEQSMNTVLVQEVIRYNRLLAVCHKSLQDLLKALKGLVVMSQQLEALSNSLFNNKIPAMWDLKAYPSLKPLSSWVEDLITRVKFIKQWIEKGIPFVYWISGFFFPQAFLTGTLQNFARRAHISIDTISFKFEILKESAQEISDHPVVGCYIYGLFVEGARWCGDEHCLTESRPKELFTDMATIWLIPMSKKPPLLTGIYECPVYKTLTRAGTLSTTGHSTNFVFTIEIPSNEKQSYWVKRGVALLCALNY